MASGVKTVIYPVKDLAQAKTLYGILLGVQPDMDAPYYVGFTAANGQRIGLDPNGHSQGMTGPIGYWHVEDVKQSLRRLLDAGAEIQQDVKDVGGGKLVVTVKDADGNVLGLIQAP